MDDRLLLPDGYKPLLCPKETEKAIRLIKVFFETNLAFELDLIRVTAPLFVEGGTGINDDLNGIEKPVAFNVKAANGTRAEIVQICDIFRARIVDVSRRSVIVEMTGNDEKIQAFLDMIEPFGVKALARTGAVAMERNRKLEL